MLGVLLIAGALMQCGLTVVFVHGAVRTSGTVVDPGPGGRHAIIRFRLPSGRMIGLVAGGIFAPVQVGETVPVLYNPASPARTAALNNSLSLWFPTALAGLIGSVLLTLSRISKT